MSLAVSFEVFPPKSEDGLAQLRSAAEQFGTVTPEFVSVTYGAGGTDRHRSFAAVDAVVTAAPVAAHVTCVGQTRADVDGVIDHYIALGVRRIVALRGDPPDGIDAPYSPHPDGFARTAELVERIKQRTDASVAVSAYPERHPQSPSVDHDLAVLRDKVAAGADLALTQMFFDNSHFLRLRDRAQAQGIGIPIVPGIFPIHSLPAVGRFAARCGATMPDRLARRFDGLAPGTDEHVAAAADVAAEQITELASHGVEQIHLYTLNRAELALEVCARLGLTSKVTAP
ncbi:MAG: methylenetetrahydrofolate reductase [Ilumatobacteraceae bacterium]